MSRAPAQAVMKVVPGGGTRNAKRIGSQLDYLGRKGDVPMERAERYHGIPVGKDDYKALAANWYAQAQNRAEETTVQQLTTHLVASFPPGTDPEDARRVGRAWAEEMFGSGRHGGRYDYVTVLHTDTPHPHVHAVVNRRSLDNDNWLKISNRDEHMNYANMIAVLVEVAAREGMELDGRTRKERGLGPSGVSLARHHETLRQGHDGRTDARDAPTRTDDRGKAPARPAR